MAIRVRGASLQIDVQVTRPGAGGTLTKVRHRESFKGTHLEALAREKEIEAALLRGDAADDLKQTKAAPSLTLHDALEATWERYWKTGGQSRTVRSNMKTCEEFFGRDKPLASITTQDADAFITHLLSRNLAPATVRQKAATMTKALRHYHKRGVIPSLPHFELPAIGDNLRDRVITAEEERVLLDLFAQRWDVVTKRRADGTPGADLHDLMVFLMDTGVRPSEAREAAKANLRGRLLTLRVTKSRQFRTVPLTARALAAFERQAERHGPVPFSWATKDTLRMGWDWARAAMGLTGDAGFIPYALRHTCATRLYDKTRDLMLVQKWMGHADIKMTLRYAKLMPGDLERAADLLEDKPSRKVA